MLHSDSLAYAQCSIRMAAAGLSNSRPLRRQAVNRNSSGPEVCLYSRSHFLCSCDILTASEVSQLFQGINDGSGSPYLTSIVQAVCFAVVLFHLPGYLGKTSDTSLLSRSRCSPCLPAVTHMGRLLALVVSEHSLHPLRVWMRCRRDPLSSGHGVPRGSCRNTFVSFVSERFLQM